MKTIREFYEEAFNKLGGGREIPDIDISFYPYVGLNQTIRVRNGRVFVRIADMCRDMPERPHRALAFILVAKLLGRRVPREADRVYSEYIKTAEMRDRSNDRKRSHGRKIVTTAKGETYDLDEIFDNLNFWYFRERLEKPVLTWSAKKTYRILGHHDATHETIVVSRSLDSPRVPRFVVEYIVFHEMLHIHHPTVHHNGRRYNHTPAFRRDERRFKHYREAEDWIEQNVHRLKRSAKRK
ncbi:MAG TPA: SprT-like domain-containing protein [Pyrinomonadaceae bacterium]